MKIIENGIMPDGTHIQIEDWKENYSFHSYADTLTAYTISKATHNGKYAPKAGEKYRFDFKFVNADETKRAYMDLLEGKKVLADFKNAMSGKLEYMDCI